MKEFTCIVCPVSCNLTVSEQNGEVTVEGNQCKRGLNFGINEYTDPKRMITTTVKLNHKELRRLPVISTEPVPKNRLIELVQSLYKIEVTTPVSRGDIVMKNIGNTGVDILATRTVK